MSKRFGRNQKRKMREVIESTVQAYEWEHSRARHYANELYKTEQLVERIKSWLGKNHPAFPAGNFDPGFKPQPEDSFFLPRGSQPLQATVMRWGKPRPDEMHKAVHFMLYAGHERFGYAITENALQFGPVEELARTIMEELTPLLIDQMRKATGEGGQ